MARLQAAMSLIKDAIETLYGISGRESNISGLLDEYYDLYSRRVELEDRNAPAMDLLAPLTH